MDFLLALQASHPRLLGALQSLLLLLLVQALLLLLTLLPSLFPSARKPVPSGLLTPSLSRLLSWSSTSSPSSFFSTGHEIGAAAASIVGLKKWAKRAAHGNFEQGERTSAPAQEERETPSEQQSE